MKVDRIVPDIIRSIKDIILRNCGHKAMAARSRAFKWLLLLGKNFKQKVEKSYNSQLEFWTEPKNSKVFYIINLALQNWGIEFKIKTENKKIS